MDWSAAELYLACRGIVASGCLMDVSPPSTVTPVEREILRLFYAAMANETRLDILLLLYSTGGLLSVGEITECIGSLDRIQSVRRHLRILHEVRVLERHWEDGSGRYQYDKRAVMAYLELTQEVLL